MSPLTMPDTFSIRKTFGRRPHRMRTHSMKELVAAVQAKSRLPRVENPWQGGEASQTSFSPGGRLREPTTFLHGQIRDVSVTDRRTREIGAIGCHSLLVLLSTASRIFPPAHLYCKKRRTHSSPKRGSRRQSGNRRPQKGHCTWGHCRPRVHRIPFRLVHHGGESPHVGQQHRAFPDCPRAAPFMVERPRASPLSRSGRLPFRRPAAGSRNLQEAIAGLSSAPRAFHADLPLPERGLVGTQVRPSSYSPSFRHRQVIL